MQQISIPLLPPTNHGSINASLQIGDAIYYIPQQNVVDGSFDTGINQAVSGSKPIKLGTLVNIDDTNSGNLIVLYDETQLGGAGQPPLPVSGDFLMFEKDSKVNSSSVIGYYMNMNLVNHSRDKIELFSIGSEISESSK